MGSQIIIPMKISLGSTATLISPAGKNQNVKLVVNKQYVFPVLIFAWDKTEKGSKRLQPLMTCHRYQIAEIAYYNNIVIYYQVSRHKLANISDVYLQMKRLHKRTNFQENLE